MSTRWASRTINGVKEWRCDWCGLFSSDVHEIAKDTVCESCCQELGVDVERLNIKPQERDPEPIILEAKLMENPTESTDLASVASDAVADPAQNKADTDSTEPEILLDLSVEELMVLEAILRMPLSVSSSTNVLMRLPHSRMKFVTPIAISRLRMRFIKVCDRLRDEIEATDMAEVGD